MRRAGLMGERLIALFLLGIVLFTPPFLGIFNVASTTAGVPTLYVYLFGAWLALIGLVVLTARRGSAAERELAAADSDGTDETVDSDTAQREA